ncbi:hypothetical protein BKA61DRAFT_718591 [Leptodontidium sp. MPI-SDFR-AT-0119]|nr:hypothetical protein BKA61DRAFT_718591 [Leptodontidium sp. MPI-SDFR-AT-0119]
MTRLIIYLTLIPTFFTFIAIVLINVGGVNPTLGSKFSLMPEENSVFSLVKWDYTLSAPQESSSEYSYHLFLNRLCVGYNSITSGSSQTIHRCRNDRFSKLEDGSRLYSLHATGRLASPFRFDTVNMDVPLAFYIMSALLVAFLMFMAPVAARGEKLRSMRRLATICTGVAFVFMVVASSVITAQMVHLRNQIRDDTRPSVAVQRGFGQIGSQAGRTVWTVDVSNVTIGATVLGLTWAAVVALMIEFVMWMLVFTSTERETPVVEMKKHEYAQG